MDDSDFYYHVERHFVERRGSPLFISPNEWSLIQRWDEMGIPLDVVIEGIDRVFERPKTTLAPRRLGYCSQTVESLFRKVREAGLGGHDVHSGEGRPPEGSPSSDLVTPSEHLERLAETVRACASTWQSTVPLMGSVLEAAADRLFQLSRADESGAIVEAELRSLESDIARRGEELLRDEAEKLRAQAEEAIGRYKGQMPEDVFNAACRSAYARRLRRRVGIPPLSLYDR